MFGFLKNKKEKAALKAKTKEVTVTKSVRPGTVITVMPNRFLVAERPIFWTWGKIIWLIAFILISGSVVAVYVLLQETRRPTPATPESIEDSAADTTAVTPQPLPSTLTPFAPVEDEPALPEPVSVTPSAPDEQADEPPAIDPVPLPAPTRLQPSTDSDQDGLTDIEEALFTTDPNSADTDGDGFSDQSELVHGYSPVGSGTLSETTLFSRYEHVAEGYAVRYPEAWTLQAAGLDGVQFIASSDEFILLLTQDNLQQRSIIDWYADTVPSVPRGTITTETVGKFTGVYSADGRTFYFVAPERPTTVFVVSHSIGTKRRIDFGTAVRLLIDGIEPSIRSGS